MREERRAAVPPMPCLAGGAGAQPIGGRQVYGLRHVEACAQGWRRGPGQARYSGTAATCKSNALSTVAAIDGIDEREI